MYLLVMLEFDVLLHAEVYSLEAADYTCPYTSRRSYNV